MNAHTPAEIIAPDRVAFDVCEFSDLENRKHIVLGYSPGPNRSSIDDRVGSTTSSKILRAKSISSLSGTCQEILGNRMSFAVERHVHCLPRRPQAHRAFPTNDDDPPGILHYFVWVRKKRIKERTFTVPFVHVDEFILQRIRMCQSQ